jgi:DJ-1 family protein
MTVLVPIANGSEEMEAVIVIDMLRRAGVDVTVAGDGDMVTCSRGIRIIPDIAIDDISDDDEYDAIVLPGGGHGVENLISNVSFASILARHAAKRGIIGAICAAPRMLHEMGLLKAGAKITSHPSTEQDLKVYDYRTDRVVTDGRVITSRGAGTAFEFALALIRVLEDDATAMRIASDIVLYE